MDNSVVHFELPADDHERAKKFYAETFGWGETDMDGPLGKYTVVQTGPADEKRMPKMPGFINGGIGPRMGNLMHPSIVINVKSIEESTKKIEASGGMILGEKMLVPNMGNYLYFRDSEGNVCSIWESLPSGV